jgi:hypothetical protein
MFTSCSVYQIEVKIIGIMFERRGAVGEEGGGVESEEIVDRLYDYNQKNEYQIDDLASSNQIITVGKAERYKENLITVIPEARTCSGQY